MSENEKKLKEEKLTKLREKLRDSIDKRVQGTPSDFDAKQVTENLPNTGSTPKRKPLPTTVEQALADGWTMGKAAGMSDPPVLSFTKDGKTISIRGEKSGRKPGLFSPLKKQKGGAVRKGDSETVQMYKHGGEVKSKKSKLAGRLAQRGYGKARK